MKSFVLLLFCLLLATASYAGTNRVATGPCANGRTWVSNFEFDDNATPVCAVGVRCDGSTYNTCSPSQSMPSGPKASVSVTGNQLLVTISSGSGRVTIHSTAQDSNLVYDVGVFSGTVSVAVTTLGSGAFTVVTHSADELGLVTDGDALSL